MMDTITFFLHNLGYSNHDGKRLRGEWVKPADLGLPRLSCRLAWSGQDRLLAALRRLAYQ